jgi:hypothetical protein
MEGVGAAVAGKVARGRAVTVCAAFFVGSFAAESHKIVSVRKGFFSAHAASIFGLACAAYCPSSYPSPRGRRDTVTLSLWERVAKGRVRASAQSLDFLAWTINPSFPDRKPIVSNLEFPDGN